MVKKVATKGKSSQRAVHGGVKKQPKKETWHEMNARAEALMKEVTDYENAREEAEARNVIAAQKLEVWKKAFLEKHRQEMRQMEREHELWMARAGAILAKALKCDEEEEQQLNRRKRLLQRM
jgi:hypothetical protein